MEALRENRPGQIERSGEHVWAVRGCDQPPQTVEPIAHARGAVAVEDADRFAEGVGFIRCRDAARPGTA